tara:strand:+ start:28012 stop:28431 length:420 start_codon:yes stop_codon:yes gene_type:complete
MPHIHCLTGVFTLAKTKVIDYEKLYNLARMGLSEEQIATSLGISASTITRRKRDDEQFDRALKAGRQEGITQVTNQLFNSATDPDKPNTSAAIFFLKNRAGWRDKAEVDANLTGSLAVDHDIDSALKALEDAGIDPSKL